tara:strand:- start:168 stop:377 length:210 start_codon:yes stop_codon:yes gene_type:complete
MLELMQEKKLEKAMNHKYFSWSVSYMISKIFVQPYCPDIFINSTTKIPIISELKNELNMISILQKINKI